MIHGLFLNYAQTIYLRSGKLKLLYYWKLIFLIDSSIYLNDCHVTIVWIPYVADVLIVGLWSQWERLNGGCEREFMTDYGGDKLIGILCEHKFLVICSVNFINLAKKFIPCQNFPNFICFHLRAMHHACDEINKIELCPILKVMSSFQSEIF